MIYKITNLTRDNGIIMEKNLSEKKYYLWNEYDYPQKNAAVRQSAPSLISFPLPDDGIQHPAIIVLPGGAFMYKEMSKEGSQIALACNRFGYHAFVLDYRVIPYKHPCQFIDAQRAVRWIRYHASDFRIDAKKISVIGFSAGGQLAGMLATNPSEGEPQAQDPIDRLSAKPYAAGLCYAVLNTSCLIPEIYPMIEKLLTKSQLKTEEYKKFSPVSCINKNTSPVFCWATSDDQRVPSTNSLDMTENAVKCGRTDCELHIFETGLHGMALSLWDGCVNQWITMFFNWLEYLYKNEKNNLGVKDGF